MARSYLYRKQKKIQQSGMKVAIHPNASIQPPLSGWESLDGCNAIGAESTPTVDLPSTVVKSGPPSIATTVVEGPTIGANVGSAAAKTSSSAVATGVRSAGTSNGRHRLSPLTK